MGRRRVAAPCQPAQRVEPLCDPCRPWLLAVWSRAWIGWAALLPIAAVVAWTFVNPRAFPPPRDYGAWMTRGVLGERLWLDRARRAIPRAPRPRRLDHHRHRRHGPARPGLGPVVARCLRDAPRPRPFDGRQGLVPRPDGVAARRPDRNHPRHAASRPDLARPRKAPRMTPQEMEARIVRYGDLRPCKDPPSVRLPHTPPGSDQKEDFTIIGGVSPSRPTSTSTFPVRPRHSTSAPPAAAKVPQQRPAQPPHRRVVLRAQGTLAVLLGPLGATADPRKSWTLVLEEERHLQLPTGIFPRVRETSAPTTG